MPSSSPVAAALQASITATSIAALITRPWCPGKEIRWAQGEPRLHPLLPGAAFLKCGLDLSRPSKVERDWLLLNSWGCVHLCVSLLPGAGDTGPRGHSLPVHIDLMVWEGKGLKLDSYGVLCCQGCPGEHRSPGNREGKTFISRKAGEACLSHPTTSPPGGSTAHRVGLVPMRGLHPQAVADACPKERPFSKRSLIDSTAW